MSLRLSGGRRISPGDLQHLVTLQKPDPTVVRDEVGERVLAYIDVATAYAGIWPLSAREQLLAAQQQGSTTHTVAIWWNPTSAEMTSAWRIKFGLRNLVLDGPPKNVDEKNVILEMSCTEGLKDE